jgi:ribonuclease J
MFTNYYKILGIKRSAKLKDIKKARNILILKYHPDANKNDGERAKEINMAFDVLSNEESREEYDYELNLYYPKEKTSHHEKSNFENSDLDLYYPKEKRSQDLKDFQRKEGEIFLEFYGGVDEIGGNKILLRRPNSTSLFFDFGLSFNTMNNYFSEFLQPRKLNGIEDFLELKILPNIANIYRTDYLKHSGFKTTKPAVDGVLLSHAHLDHSADIHFLHEDIPIFMSEESYLILHAMQSTGSTTFSEYTIMKRSFHYVPKKRGEGFTPLGSKYTQFKRKINFMTPYKPTQIGDLIVEAVPVDHSLPGALAFLIESPEERIIYTGDLRFHGRNRHLTEKFIERAMKFKPTVMLCEGTRINVDYNTIKAEDETENTTETRLIIYENTKTDTEEEIEIEGMKLIEKHDGLVIVNFPVRDTDRLISFRNIAEKTNRKLAINMKQAYLLKLFEGKENSIWNLPKLNDPSICIYIPRKGSGSISDEHYFNYMPSEDFLNPEEFNSYDNWKTTDFKFHGIERDYKIWEREFLTEEYDTINYRDLQNNPEKYIFRCDFFELKELLDIKPENGIYIHSSTEPFNEEMEIDRERTENWLKYFNLYPYEKMHVSGHANGKEIIDMIKKIKPEKLYPIHTEESELFDILEEEGIEVIHPNRYN